MSERYTPPGYNWSYMSMPATLGKIALSAGCPSEAAMYWVMPRYEPPYIPTFPSLQGCVANHSIISRASSVSASEKSP